MLKRLLIVGLGSIGKRHARIARDLIPELQIVALRRRAEDTDAESGVDAFVSSMEQALAFRPQAAVIANPASHHLEAAVALARAGVHLLVEKPISDTTSGVDELIRECRIRGLALMTAYNLRFVSSLRRFRELLADGGVGRVLSVHAEVGQFLPTWRPAVDYRQTVSARAALGGGVLLELSHEIDYLRWLFGEVEWVWAVLGRRSRLEIDVEDTAHIALAFADQTGGAPLVATLNMDFLRHNRSRCCSVIGESASVRWDGIAGTVDTFEQGSESWKNLFANREHVDESYRCEWRHFLQVIAGGEPLVSGEDGLATLRIIEAARKSARDGAIVRVPSSAGATAAWEMT